MDLNCLITNKKHCRGEEKVESKTTTIFDLPDHIMEIITSSLSIKEATRACFVSKRWMHRLITISEIELKEETHDCVNLKKRQTFIDFVKSLLYVYNISNLRKFSLAFEVGRDSTLVNEWLNRFIGPNIEELSLHFEGQDTTIMFPKHMVTSETLTCFHLRLRQILMLPLSIHFQSLRILTLQDVAFRDYGSSNKFFSGCPSLEKLSLIDCCWGNMKVVNISCPFLQEIVIRESREDSRRSHDLIVVGDDNIKAPYRCRLLINGIMLKTFSYEGVCTNEYFIYGSPSVIKASINATEIIPRPGHFLFILVVQISTTVQRLSISDTFIQILGRFLFIQLAELYLIATEPPYPKKFCNVAFLNILHNSIFLQVLNLKEVSLPQLDEDSICKLDSTCDCFKTHLKFIRINHFSGYKHELLTIKKMLQSAKVLEKFYIRFNPNPSLFLHRSGASKFLRQMIEGFPRGSMHCEIVFEDF